MSSLIHVFSFLPFFLTFGSDLLLPRESVIQSLESTVSLSVNQTHIYGHYVTQGFYYLLAHMLLMVCASTHFLIPPYRDYNREKTRESNSHILSYSFSPFCFIFHFCFFCCTLSSRNPISLHLLLRSSSTFTPSHTVAVLFTTYSLLSVLRCCCTASSYEPGIT